MPDEHRVSWLSAGMDGLPADDTWMDDAEAERIGAMDYAKRRMESTLSRHTAKTTLVHALGLEPEARSLARVTVRNASDGAPEAYLDGRELDVVIAMTDRADWAVCAVLHGNVRVGCDLELVEPRSDAFIRDYFTPHEQAVAMSADGRQRHLRANLIWSAKESALKVLRTGLRVDTRTVEVRLDLAGETDGWTPLEVRGADMVFPGWWQRFGDFLLTIVAAGPVAEPASLVQPPALADAVPSHRWLERPRLEQ
jgi:4'-phosphopantetheinyl transferase